MEPNHLLKRLSLSTGSALMSHDQGYERARFGYVECAPLTNLACPD